MLKPGESDRPRDLRLNVDCGGVRASLVHYAADTYHARHSHDFTQASFLLAGRMLERLGRHEYELDQPSIGLKPAGVAHEDRWGEEGVLIFSIGLSDESARRKGLRLYDVSRAASFVISSLFYIDRGGEDLDAGHLDALRLQMREILRSDGQFQRLSNGERQELYESFIIQGMFLSSAFETARQEGNRAKLDEIRTLARRNIEEILGAPADRVQFGASGLSFR